MIPENVLAQFLAKGATIGNCTATLPPQTTSPPATVPATIIPAHLAQPVIVEQQECDEEGRPIYGGRRGGIQLPRNIIGAAGSPVIGTPANMKMDPIQTMTPPSMPRNATP
jgi:hypothetical protein